jgi:hypothetical protein
MIVWLSDNGSGSIAYRTKSLAQVMGLEPRTTPVQSTRTHAQAILRVSRRKGRCAGETARRALRYTTSRFCSKKSGRSTLFSGPVETLYLLMLLISCRRWTQEV